MGILLVPCPTGLFNVSFEHHNFTPRRILFHRSVYPAEDFYVEKRFGLDLTLILVSSVEDYIELTLHRLRGALSWLLCIIDFVSNTHNTRMASQG